MKKIINVSVGLVLFLSILSVYPVSAQSAKQGKEAGKPIPADVTKIVEKSCGSCHSEPGNFMALPHVNFTKWDTYSPEKQAAKAKAICDEITNAQMPPKKFRKNHPDSIPTSAEIKAICDWAQSLQVVAK